METFSSEDLSIIAHETVVLKIDNLTNQIKAPCILWLMQEKYSVDQRLEIKRVLVNTGSNIVYNANSPF